MGRPTVTKKYPQYWISVLERLTKDPTKPVVLIYNSEKDRNNARLEFLGFKNAALREGWDKPVITPKLKRFEGDLNEVEETPAPYPQLAAYTTRTREAEPPRKGFLLEIWHTDWTPTAIATQKALDELDEADREQERQTDK